MAKYWILGTFDMYIEADNVKNAKDKAEMQLDWAIDDGNFFIKSATLFDEE